MGRCEIAERSAERRGDCEKITLAVVDAIACDTTRVILFTSNTMVKGQQPGLCRGRICTELPLLHISKHLVQY